MIRLTLLVLGAVVGLLVAIEAANFAVHHMALKGLPRLNEHAGVLETRIWTAIATASLAWIATVKLAAMSITELRSRRSK